MFNKFERMVAFRYLRARRKEGFVSVVAGFAFVGIVLGVAALIVVMSVMNGFHTEIQQRILGINAHVSVSSYQQSVHNYDRITEEIRKIPGVTKAAPVIHGKVLAEANGAYSGAAVRGMTPADLRDKTIIAEGVSGGKLEDFGGTGVIIGWRLALSMNLRPGDNIRLISPQTNETFIGAIPRLKDYHVVAIFDTEMYEYDSTTIFMPLAAAQKYFRLKGAVNSIEAEIAEIDNTEPVKAAIAQVIAEIDTQYGSQAYNISDWKELNGSYFETLMTERVVMFIVLSLIIVIAAFNVISGMVMLVIGKKKEIAILRTMGAGRWAIIRIFFMCGALIGLLGTFFGWALGISFALNIEEIRQWLQGITGTELFNPVVYYLSQLPSDVDAGEVMNVVILAIVISLLAPIFPALRAARVNPAEGVRY